MKLRHQRVLVQSLLPRQNFAATVAFLFAILAVFTVPPVFGSGEEKTTNGDDLIIRTDSRWAGGGAGGYLPIRVLVSNHGQPRDLTFEFDPSVDGHGVRARQVIGVEQNATVHFTLSVPLVDARDGRLYVSEDGRRLSAHSRSISLPAGLSSPSPPAMLVIAPAVVDCGRFVEAANHLTSGPARATYRGGPGADASLLAQVVQPSLLPESWIDYSGLDLLAVSREDLERLDRPVRTAILKWTQCGGNLLIFDVGNDAAASSQLDRLIEAADQPDESAKWKDAVPSMRHEGVLTDVSAPELGGGMPMPTPGPVRFSRATTPKSATTTPKPVESPWPKTSGAFRHRELMLGAVYAFPANPFPGSVNDWVWLCNTCTQPRWSWTHRHGTSPGIGGKDFYKFMNPGIQGVPTIAFLVLITLFSVLIGPVNYVYLSRKKMLWMLLFTVPALALTTTVLLVGYSVAAHGFSVKSRIRSLTVLDQRHRTTVTMSRLALFAGVAPSNGLRFSPETAVYPVIPTTNEPKGGLVDWTQTQNLVSGWFPARTRTQFYTVRNAEQRSRVDFKSLGAKTAEFSNGLPWELEMVVASDEAGHLYVGRSVPAGATATLSEPSSQDLKDFCELLKRNPPALPAGFVEPTVFSRGRRAFTPYSSYGDTTDFSSNLMERQIAQWITQLPSKHGLAPRSYVAVLRQNPSVETGVASSTDEMSLHLLNGTF